jgi:glycosyltransferase involved in cell wall biosynthesis
LDKADTRNVESSTQRAPRVLIVCEHASFRFGGEASLPLHYFTRLRRRGIETWMVTHERTRDEIAHACATDLDRIVFVKDNAFNRLCWRLESRLPSMVSHFTIGYASRLATQLEARRIARDIIRRHKVTILHQPIPVSPREPSFLYDMGCPVVIGPMNGNMTYPEAFQPSGAFSGMNAVKINLARAAAQIAHRVVPGKLRGAALLHANERTRAALPQGSKGEMVAMHENAVDLAVWQCGDIASDAGKRHFVFMGRLIGLKNVDIAILALARMKSGDDVTLEIIGSGPEEDACKALVADLGLGERVIFSGWLPQAQCADRVRGARALLLPSVRECGGAVVLEAMACGTPAVATRWGGPSDYIDETCGILVEPTSREAMIAGFAAAMERLANDAQYRDTLARSARQRIVDHFDWDKRIDSMMLVYQRHQATAAVH